ncbi:MAG: DUF4157 domain-containing protein [Cyanobacteria bacterium P01_G01_bin.54]
MVYSAPSPKSKQPRSFKPQPSPSAESAEPQVQREEQDKSAVAAERPWGQLTDQMPPPPDSGGPLWGTDGLVVQRDLTLGEANDPYEQEADQVAEQVVKQINAPRSAALDSGSDTPGIQLQAQRPTLQLDGDGGGDTVPAPVEQKINQARGGGRPLSGEMQQKLSPVMGEQVVKETRIHTGEVANEICEGTNATAATTQRDVFFKRGKFNETSTEGQKLITHELTHRQQQSGKSLQGRSSGVVQRLVENDDEKIQLAQYPSRSALLRFLKEYTTNENAEKLVKNYDGQNKPYIKLSALISEAEKVPRVQKRLKKDNADIEQKQNNNEENNNDDSNNAQEPFFESLFKQGAKAAGYAEDLSWYEVLLNSPAQMISSFESSDYSDVYRQVQLSELDVGTMTIEELMKKYLDAKAMAAICGQTSNWIEKVLTGDMHSVQRDKNFNGVIEGIRKANDESTKNGTSMFVRIDSFTHSFTVEIWNGTCRIHQSYVEKYTLVNDLQTRGKVYAIDDFIKKLQEATGVVDNDAETELFGGRWLPDNRLKLSEKPDLHFDVFVYSPSQKAGDNIKQLFDNMSQEWKQHLEQPASDYVAKHKRKKQAAMKEQKYGKGLKKVISLANVLGGYMADVKDNNDIYSENDLKEDKIKDHFYEFQIKDDENDKDTILVKGKVTDVDEDNKTLTIEFD